MTPRTGSGRFQWGSVPMVVGVLATMAAALFSFPMLAQDDYTERMAREHKDDQPIASEAARLEPSSPVIAERVVYATLGERSVQGYLARPEDPSGPLPGLIVIHEWWGLNPNIEVMARRLAGEGYVALAVDLYGGRVGETREEARELMQASFQDLEAANSNLRQAYGFLSETLGAPKVGAIGWCFGGAWSLSTALLLPEDIDASVIYYGRLVTDPEQLETLQMPILGHFGSEDQGIPLSSVREFEAALQQAGKSAQIYVYEGADHAFANPSGTRFHPDAAALSWERTVEFLAGNLKK